MSRGLLLTVRVIIIGLVGKYMKIAIIDASTGTVFIRDTRPLKKNEVAEDLAHEEMESVGASVSDCNWIVAEKIYISMKLT